MSKYIKRETVLAHLQECEGTPPEIAYTFPIYKALERFVEEIPAADVAQVVRGRWELRANDDDTGCSYFCSRCGASYDEDWFYNHGRFVPFGCCPNCFARMDGDT